MRTWLDSFWSRGVRWWSAVNKWDTVDAYEKDRVKVDIVRKLPFWTLRAFILPARLRSGRGWSAQIGVGGASCGLYAADAEIDTRVLQAAIEHQAPPRKGQGSNRPKLRYAHQVGKIHRSLLFMVTRWKMCRKPISAISKVVFARHLNCKERLCVSSLNRAKSVSHAVNWRLARIAL